MGDLGAAFLAEEVEELTNGGAGATWRGPQQPALIVVNVWETKEDSEHFFAERMVPALQQLGIQGGPPLSDQEFELPYELRG